MQPKLIVFDLNHTLIRDNSWRNLNLAMGITPEEDAALMARAARGEITDAEGGAACPQPIYLHAARPDGCYSASSARLPCGY